MTDVRFEQLVNLYLDREISPRELRQLVYQISRNRERRSKFIRLQRIHSAELRALGASPSSTASDAERLSDLISGHSPKKNRKPHAGELQERRFKRFLWSAIALTGLSILAFSFYVGVVIGQSDSQTQHIELVDQLSTHPFHEKQLGKPLVNAVSARWLEHLMNWGHGSTAFVFPQKRIFVIFENQDFELEFERLEANNGTVNSYEELGAMVFP